MSIFTLLDKLHKWFSPSDRSNDIEVKFSLVRLKSGVTYSLLGGLDITQALMIIYYKPLKVVTIELSSGPVYVDWDDIEHTEPF